MEQAVKTSIKWPKIQAKVNLQRPPWRLQNIDKSLYIVLVTSVLVRKGPYVIEKRVTNNVKSKLHTYNLN